MIIPLIPKDPDADDFTCRDGEIEFITIAGESGADPGLPDGDTPDDAPVPAASTGYGIRFALTPAGDFPTFNIRIPLREGEEEKAALMMNGEISRVDAATAERITGEITRKAAAEFSRLVIDCRRMGLYLLPFRVYGMIRLADGSLAYPSAQAVMLPAEYPPHPEITASGISADTLTLSLRVTAKPHRLSVTPPAALEAGCRVATFVSYPLYIPKEDEITGSLGSVRSAGEGNALGIRFSFLTTSSLKYSVAAPEKYYQLIGNANTGYRCASKAADAPDYTCYAKTFGFVPSFPAASLLPEGSEADPLGWIADWESAGEGYLPVSLPSKYRGEGGGEGDDATLPGGVAAEYIDALAEATGFRHVVLTRPMTFAEAERSRRKAKPRGVAAMRILGLSEAGCLAVLLGSNDGTTYLPLRQWNPHATTLLLSPPRLFHRLLLLCAEHRTPIALDVTLAN